MNGSTREKKPPMELRMLTRGAWKPPVLQYRVKIETLADSAHDWWVDGGWSEWRDVPSVDEVEADSDLLLFDAHDSFQHDTHGQVFSGPSPMDLQEGHVLETLGRRIRIRIVNRHEPENTIYHRYLGVYDLLSVEMMGSGGAPTVRKGKMISLRVRPHVAVESVSIQPPP